MVRKRLSFWFKNGVFAFVYTFVLGVEAVLPPVKGIFVLPARHQAAFPTLISNILIINKLLSFIFHLT